jgi:transposase-like protein
MTDRELPKTLIGAARYFADKDVCIELVAGLRWQQGVRCVHCGADRVSFLTTRRIWKCIKCRKQFSVKTGTIFEDSPIGLDKWLTALWLIVNCKNGISSWEIHRSVGVTQKTAWFMLHRIRLAMKTGDWGGPAKMGFGGPVEADECFVGPNPQKMHKSRKAKIQARDGFKGGLVGKTAVQGVLDRELRQVRAQVIPNIKRETLQAAILDNVTPFAKVFTDEATGYEGLGKNFVHKVVNHTQEYVRGQVHTNGMENFWSLLKRQLKGTYIAVEPFHLDRYVDEQVFRFNNRATKDNPLDDRDRFMMALTQISGKRLTYKELTGKTDDTTSVPF